jgi:hypothetical protein
MNDGLLLYILILLDDLQLLLLDIFNYHLLLFGEPKQISALQISLLPVVEL